MTLEHVGLILLIWILLSALCAVWMAIDAALKDKP